MTTKRILAALLVSIPLVLLICLAVTINNFYFANALIADDYLMPVVVLAMLMVVLALNPLLSLISKDLRLDRAQLALIFGIALAAAAVTSGGFIRQTLHALPYTINSANRNHSLSEAYKQMAPPPSLYPDSLEYDAQLPVIAPFIDELAENEEIPWKAWIKPTLAWSGFIVPWFMMMVAMAVIFFANWRDHERLPMPLFNVHRALIDIPEEGGCVPVLFRNRSFWTAAGIVFFLHFLTQGHRYWPGTLPSFPFGWQLWGCFSEMPWRHLPGMFKYNSLYFTFLGVAFFIPKRISFSLWFGTLVFCFYVMMRNAYAPSTNPSAIPDFRSAAFMTFPLVVLWLARRHLARVARAAVHIPRTPEDRAHFLMAWSLVIGMLGMWLWLRWANVPGLWAAGLVAGGFLSALALMRVFAETGLPLFFAQAGIVLSFVSLIPTGARTLAGMYFSGLLAVWYGPAQRICVATVIAQAIGMNAKQESTHHVRLGALFLVVLIIALLITGAFTLQVAYRNSSNVAGGALAQWGSRQFETAQSMLLNTFNEKSAPPLWDHVPAMLLGVVMTLGTYALYLFSPHWPLHPVALICVGSWGVMKVAPSVFGGWLLKVLILRYGGARVHRKAEPIFLGLALGEVFALIFWVVFGAYRAAMDMTYNPVDILPH